MWKVHHFVWRKFFPCQRSSCPPPPCLSTGKNCINRILRSGQNSSRKAIRRKRFPRSPSTNEKENYLQPSCCCERSRVSTFGFGSSPHQVVSPEHLRRMDGLQTLWFEVCRRLRLRLRSSSS